LFFVEVTDNYLNINFSSLFMNKRILVILSLIVLILAIIGMILLTQFGKGCTSDESCKNYCHQKGTGGVRIGYVPICKNMNCECICPSGFCD
jgi:hypothetical protein